MKTVILYKSVYGSTKQYAEWISERIPESCVFNISESISLQDADSVIIGYPVYMDRIPDEVKNFMSEHSSILRYKATGVFIVCLEPEITFMKGKLRGSHKYLKEAIDSAGIDILHAASFTGEINPNRLSGEHLKAMSYFYSNVLKEPVDKIPFRTGLDKKKCWDFAEEFMNRAEGGA